MSHAEFVPAIGEQFNSVWRRGLNYNGFDLKFFTKQSHFEHNIALQSCYYGMEGVGKKYQEEGNHYRDMIKFPKEKTLIGDSGGFQMASFKKRGEHCDLTPIKSLRWQEANCDIGMNLDIPPTLGDMPDYHDSFKPALKESVENFRLFEKERKNDKMILLNVLHGENIKLMDEWYDAVKGFNFEGWAVGMKPPFDPMIQAMGFMYLYEKGEFDKDSCKWLHFFGTSGKHVVPTIVYIATKLNKIRVTYDSSSYNIGSIYRTYYLPFDIGPHLSFGEKFTKINPKLEGLPCQCPVCSSVKDINDLNKPDIYAGTLISLHNMYQYIYYNNILNKLVTNMDIFMDYLDKINIGVKTLKSIEFIDFAMKKGVKSAVEKFAMYLVPQDVEKTQQGSIYQF